MFAELDPSSGLGGFSSEGGSGPNTILSMDETSLDLSIGVWSLGNSGASLIFRRSSVVVNLGLASLSKSSSNAQIKAEVKEAFPGLLVVPLGEVAARYSNDLNSSLALRSSRSPRGGFLPSAQTSPKSTEIASIAAVKYHKDVRMSVVQEAFGMIPDHREIGVVTMDF